MVVWLASATGRMLFSLSDTGQIPSGLLMMNERMAAEARVLDQKHPAFGSELTTKSDS